MTTAVAKAKSTPQLPAELLAGFQAEALKLRERLGSNSGDFVSVTRNKTFRMPGSDEEGPELRCVIVDWVTLHQFYPGKYDSKNPVPPVCVAIGENTTGLVPFADVPDRQADNCDDCGHNKWVNGKKGCKNQFQLALLPVDNQDEADFMILKVSPTGLKRFTAYARKIAGLNPTLPHVLSVVTRIRCDPDEEFPTLLFESDGPNMAVNAAALRRAAAHERLMTPPTFTVPIKKAT